MTRSARSAADQRFQSLGKAATQPLRARLWSIDGSARAMWRRILETGGTDDVCEWCMAGQYVGGPLH